MPTNFPYLFIYTILGYVAVYFNAAVTPSAGVFDRKGRQVYTLLPEVKSRVVQQALATAQFLKDTYGTMVFKGGEADALPNE